VDGRTQRQRPNDWSSLEHTTGRPAGWHSDRGINYHHDDYYYDYYYYYYYYYPTTAASSKPMW